MNYRRDALKGAIVATGTLAVLPKQWSRPIVNTVLLPAHAQTSCSGFTTTTVNESLTLTVTDSSVSGPIIATRSGNTFNQTESTDVGGCRNGNTLNTRVDFSGTINSTNNSISGDINILQTCGGEFVCEQLSSFSVIQTPANLGSNGSYEGTVSGTLRCCDDF